MTAMWLWTTGAGSRGAGGEASGGDEEESGDEDEANGALRAGWALEFDAARKIAMGQGRGYQYTMVAMYHDTMPKKEGAYVWPAHPPAIPNEDILDRAIAAGMMLCGNPEEVAAQAERYQEVGCDQLVFGMPADGMAHEQVLECIELFGSKVIPEWDRDPIHSTTRYRETAQPKYPMFNNPPTDLVPEVLPEHALIR